MKMDKLWYEKNIYSLLLYPFSLIYRIIMVVRRTLYKVKLLKTIKLPVPVIVVGNLTVGGTGKTPLLISLVAALKAAGFSPGVVSRGYGGKSTVWPQLVSQHSDVAMVGDEPALIMRHAQVPVCVDPKRSRAARKLLLEHPECDVILSDDGLQHLALGRDLEIAVVDGEREFGNGFCLPAGPLREPLSRLASIDFVVMNGVQKIGTFAMYFEPVKWVNVANPALTKPLTEKFGRSVIAVVGVGNPSRFLETLSVLGMAYESRIFPDHYKYKTIDLSCNPDQIIVMTEKDAVKCRSFADERHWYLAGDAVFDKKLVHLICDLIRQA